MFLMRGEELKNIKTNSLYSNGDRVDLNNLMQKVRDEEKKAKRSSVIISAVIVSAITVFGIILTI
tara:strand:- start:337 stop:531 length:195 start_codon:yes stop_codon:yes gene_type:complete